MTEIATPPRRGRLGREFRTMQHMTVLYCRHHHDSGDRAVCHECDRFLRYAEARLAKCPYGEEKPTCANCPIHCYKREPRDFARKMMRYAGPRMTTRHPWLAAMHLIDGRRRVEHPMALRRSERRR